jgi:hypothetical protein
MVTVPEIKTRFTLDGLKQAATGLRGFARTLSDALSDTRRRGGSALAPLDRSLTTVEKHAKVVSKEVLKIGSAQTWRGLKLGALGAGTAFVGLRAKITAVSGAAIKASTDTAASLKAISIDAQRVGGSNSDVAVLGYAADRTGTDRDELITQIATISNEFLTLRESISDAATEYETFLGMTAKEAALAARLGNRDGMKGVVGGFGAADLEARKASYVDIEDRMEQIDADLNQMYASGDSRSGTYGDAARYALIKERQELETAAKAFEKSQSPQGQALFELLKYDVDFDRAANGGVEGLVAISEAFQRVQDPSAKARIAMRLFGEDAGVKLVPLLNGGRKAIEEYRAEMERLGGIATDEDVALGDAYSKSAQNLQTAIGGVRLEISRNLLPYLTETSVQLTEWFVKSRKEIAAYAKEAFLSTRDLAEDAISLFGGDTSNLQTKWLDTLVKKTTIVRDIWKNVRRQVSLLWEGKDSDYGWLNKLRDGFLEVKKFALDAWAVVSGGNAENFKWLNSARDQVVAFVGRLSEAFGMLKELLSGVADFFRPVFDYLGKDVATFGLFLGLTRMLGLFGTLTAAAGLFGKALGGVFALAGGALAAGKAVAGVGGAAGAASATAAGLTSSLVAVGTTISAIVGGAALLGTSLAGGFALGQMAAKAFFADTQKAYENVWEQQAALIRAQDLGHVNALLRERGTDRSRAFQKNYYGRDGINIGWQGMTTDEQIAAGREKFRQNGFTNDPSAYEGGRVYGGDVIGDTIRRRNAQPPAAVFRYDIKVNGTPATVTGDMDLKRALDELNNGFS